MAKKKAISTRKTSPAVQPALLTDLRGVIEAARQHTAQAVNSALVMMYWQIGQRIRQDVLGNKRAEYGKEIVDALSRQLTAEYGSGFTKSSLSRERLAAQESRRLTDQTETDEA